MATAEAHLDADLADARPPPPTPSFTAARRDADAILAAGIQHLHRSLLSATDSRVRSTAGSIGMLAHVAAFGSRSPWIGPLIEWGLGAIACALLLVWAFRTVRRQRVRMQFEAARRIEQTDERVLNWMREAEEPAPRASRFRDAVHCLYWATIVTLEGRRLWQPDRARTPREYLRLLDPASPVSSLLRRQTFRLRDDLVWPPSRRPPRLRKRAGSASPAEDGMKKLSSDCEIPADLRRRGGRC